MYVMIVSMFVLISYHKYPQSNTPIIVKVEKLKTLIPLLRLYLHDGFTRHTLLPRIYLIRCIGISMPCTFLLHYIIVVYSYIKFIIIKEEDDNDSASSSILDFGVKYLGDSL